MTNFVISILHAILDPTLSASTIKPKNSLIIQFATILKQSIFLESELVGHTRIALNSLTPKLVRVQLFNVARVNSHVI